MIHNWTEVCNLLEFKLDCSPSTKISFIVDRIIDRHGGASFLDDRGGELHSESSQFSDSLEELMQDLSICFSSICWVYCIIQSTSPLTVYLSIGSKLDAADIFQLLQLRASDSGHFRAWTSFLTGLAIFIFPQKINFVLPKLMVEMIIFPGFSHDFPIQNGHRPGGSISDLSVCVNRFHPEEIVCRVQGSDVPGVPAKNSYQILGKIWENDDVNPTT